MSGIRNWLINRLYPKISPKVEEMRKIWDDLGEPIENQEVDIVLSMEEAESLILRIMDRKLRQLTTRRGKLLDISEAHTRRLYELCEFLDIPVVEPEEGLKIIRLEDCLQKRVKELEIIRDDRANRLEELRTLEMNVAEFLGEKRMVLSQDVLTESVLETVKKHCDSLTEEKTRRQNKFKMTKEKILHLMNELEYTPDTTFERDIVCDSEGTFHLTQVNMNGIEAFAIKLTKDLQRNASEAKRLRDNLHLLWDVLLVEPDERQSFLDAHVGHRPSVIEGLKKEVSRCRKLKLQNAGRYIEKVRSEIQQLWNKCYYSLQQRRAFKFFYIEEMTEDLLENHDEELQRLKDVYVAGEEVYNLFKKRSEMWDKLLKFEKPTDDPKRFNNRGGRLLLEEKERKKLMVLLPKLETELEKVVNDWEAEHKRCFLINGMQVMDYVRDQWQVHDEEKEKEKIERQRMKARKLEDELINGSKANISRKRLMSTPGKENKSKVAKVTPMSANVNFSRLPTSSIITSSRPPRVLSKQSTVRKTRVLPRRLLAQQSRNPNPQSAADQTNTFIAAAENCRVDLLGTSHTSTYSEFTKNINRRCRFDNHSRSSAVTPQSPGTPRRYMRDRLGLPFLL